MNKYVTEIKTGREWIQSSTETDPEEVFRSLSEDLYRKKILGSQSIRSIKRTVRYDGYARITVTYSDDCRRVYTVRF